MNIRVKRIYERQAKADGKRVLVDRIWPRGMKKEEAGVDRWLRDVAPSGDLRKWFGHRPERWQGFRERYHRELDATGEALEELRRMAEEGTVTLVYSARDTEHNNAVALRDYLLKQ